MSVVESCHEGVDLPNRIDDVVVDPLRVLRTDAHLDESVEDLQRRSTAIRAILDRFTLGTVERGSIGMPGPLVDHGLLDGQ